MGADLSRVRLNALLDYAGVELKQGGLLLDADANELMAIVDRRLRALASDTLGRATVSSTTPDAFKISASGATLSIAKGRLYVDGLLAENHGAVSTDPTKRVFDDLLAESCFTDAIDYAAQPYSPSPAPVLPGSGSHLVYLDVWDREVTQLENPDLVENAVGVETGSRVQTVWQVRVLGDEAGTATCDTQDKDLPGWSDVIAPSSGVLSTGTFAVAPAADPCELPPTGGYRGLENQLYRVEIHDEGLPGATATFKWSRENASVGSGVTAIVSGTELELETLGRDDVLRFNVGDWIEITDDNREFSQSPGVMRRITVIAEGTRRIQFLTSINGSGLSTANHMRVRRWDQKGLVFRTDGSGTPVQVQDLDAGASTGVIAVPGPSTTLLLEQGVTVTFDATGSPGFRAGDYWVFAARTADASVEMLDRASPRGIHHHYCRLAMVSSSGGQLQVTNDCRVHFPPDGGSVPPAPPMIQVTGTSWRNDDLVSVSEFVNKGLRIDLSGAPWAHSPAGQTPERLDSAALTVTLNVPYTATPFALGNASTEVELAGSNAITSGQTTASINWAPVVAKDLAQQLEVILRTETNPRVRVRLSGHVVWGGADPNTAYLDGRALGEPGTRTDGSPRTDLHFPSGVGVRGTDFESWFYLSAQPPKRPPLQVESVTFVDKGGALVSAIPTKGEPIPPFRLSLKDAERASAIRVRFTRPVAKVTAEMVYLKSAQNTPLRGKLAFPDSQTVELTPAITKTQRFPFLPRLSLTLVARGTTPSIVAADDGTALDGDFDGTPGKDFTFQFAVESA